MQFLARLAKTVGLLYAKQFKKSVVWATFFCFIPNFCPHISYAGLAEQNFRFLHEFAIFLLDNSVVNKLYRKDGDGMLQRIQVEQMGLAPAQVQRYRSFCTQMSRTLVRRHGPLGRLARMPDLAFLALLLTSLREGGGSGPAPGPDNPYTDYVADMAVALRYQDYMDNWLDDHSYRDLALAKLLEPARLNVLQRYPRQCAAAHSCLSRLHRGEQQNCTDIEQMSSYWGQVMAEIFDFCRGSHGEQLRALGDATGRLFYLLDAWEDLPHDQRTGAYNPLAHLADSPDFESDCRALLDRQRQLALDALDKLPLRTDCALAERLLLSLAAPRPNPAAHRRPVSRRAV